MNVKKVETKVYTEHLYCSCGGELTATDSAHQSGTGPTLYWHSCDKCDKVVDLDNIYPRLVYEEVEVKE